MTDIIEALTQAVTDACGRHPSSAQSVQQAGWNAPLWTALEQIGITLLSVPEEQGGSGGDLGTAAAVLHVLGEHSATLPFVETALLAGWLLAESGAPIPSGPMTAAVGTGALSLTAADDGQWVLDGELTRVPWVSTSEHLVLLVGREVVTVRVDELEVRTGSNVAGEPREVVRLDGRTIPADRVHSLPQHSEVTPELFAARGAVGRMAMIGGAAHRAMDLSIGYSGQRQQFGRPLAKFQSVQQQIAVLASETLLSKVAAEAAAQSLDNGSAWELPVAAAKVAVGHAAGTVARIAHQIHGAIGVTEEHDLRYSTTRLWSWRDEFGAVGERAVALGALVEAAGADGLWQQITETLSIPLHPASPSPDGTVLMDAPVLPPQ